MNHTASHSNLSFFKQFLKNPIETGAILPSSESLSEEIVSYIDFAQPACIVEVGTGMGTFTQEILSRIAADSLYV